MATASDCNVGQQDKRDNPSLETLSSGVMDRELLSYNSHDLDGFMSTFSPTVKIWSFPENSLLLNGKEQVRDFFKNHRFNIPDLKAVLLNRTTMGNTIINRVQLLGLEDEPVDTIEIFRINNELIECVWIIRK